MGRWGNRWGGAYSWQRWGSNERPAGLQSAEKLAKPDTLFLGKCAAASDTWAELEVDRARPASSTTTVISNGVLIQGTHLRRTGEWSADIEVDADADDDGYLWDYRSSTTERRYIRFIGATDPGEIRVFYRANGGQQFDIAIPSNVLPTSGRQRLIFCWSAEANPLTTGASDAMRSHLQVFNRDAGTYWEHLWTHDNFNTNVPSGTPDIVVGRLGTADSAVFTGGVWTFRYSTRFHSQPETALDFVDSGSNFVSGVQARREVLVPDSSSALGQEGYFMGPVHACEAADLQQKDLLLAGPLWNEVFSDYTMLSQTGATPSQWVRADPVNSDFQMLGQHFVWAPVPPGANKLHCRLCVRTAISSGGAPVDPGSVFVRVVSMSRPPDLQAGAQPVPYVQFTTNQAEISVTSTTASDTWVDLGMCQIASDPIGVGGTYLCIEGYSTNTGSDDTTWAIRAVCVEPVIDESTAGEFSVGGGTIGGIGGGFG